MKIDVISWAMRIVGILIIFVCVIVYFTMPGDKFCTEVKDYKYGRLINSEKECYKTYHDFKSAIENIKKKKMTEYADASGYDDFSNFTGINLTRVN